MPGWALHIRSVLGSVSPKSQLFLLTGQD